MGFVGDAYGNAFLLYVQAGGNVVASDQGTIPLSAIAEPFREVTAFSSWKSMLIKS